MLRFTKFFLIVFFLIPFSLQASTLYMEIGASEYGPGDSFAADIYLEIGEECVNTIAASISYPADYLSVIDFIHGESIINLWLDKPNTESFRKANELGILTLSGGIPGGYCGRIPGDPGRSNLVGRIIFSIPSLIISDIERESISLNFIEATTKVLLNDGYGTEDDLNLAGAEFKVGKKATQEKKEWKEQIDNDTIRPEPFIVELRRDKDMFENRFYIIFHAIDKQSGVDHYEVFEASREQSEGEAKKETFFEKLFLKTKPVPEWKIAVMPYVLEDQELESIIRVKAVDKAGNERFVEYVPPAEFKVAVQKPFVKTLVGLLIILGIIIIVVIIFIFLKKRKLSIKKDEEI